MAVTRRARDQAVDDVDGWLITLGTATLGAKIPSAAVHSLVDAWAARIDDSEKRGRLAGLREALAMARKSAKPAAKPGENAALFVDPAADVGAKRVAEAIAAAIEAVEAQETPAGRVGEGT